MSHHTEQINQHKKFLRIALEEALIGYKEGGIPIGSVIVHNDRIIGRGYNRRIQLRNLIVDNLRYTAHGQYGGHS